MAEQTPIIKTSRVADTAGTAWDIVVVGAGPAGSIAALVAARQGASVLLVDKAPFPRAKVCGGCLNLRTLSVLDELGLTSTISEAGGMALQRFYLRTKRSRADIPLPGGMAVSRKTLDALLVREAVAAGTTFVSPATASLGPVDFYFREVRLSNKEQSSVVRARVVLSADGLGGSLLQYEPGFRMAVDTRSYIGVGALLDSVPDWCEPGVIYMACGRGGYVGCTVAENGRTDMAAALAPRFVRGHGSAARAVETLLAGVDLPVEQLEQFAWRGTPPLTRKANRRSAARCLVVGDAAGYVEPFTGEGMAWAVTSGSAAADLACANLEHFDSMTEREWEKRYEALIADTQHVCRMVAAGLRYPALVNAATTAIALWPGIVTPFVRRINARSPTHQEILACHSQS